MQIKLVFTTFSAEGPLCCSAVTNGKDDERSGDDDRTMRSR